MKKIITILLALSMFINVSQLDVSAKQKNNNKKEPKISDLADYVVGGSGTREDPYIIDDDCPYKEVLDENIELMFGSDDGGVIPSKFSSYSTTKITPLKLSRSSRYNLVYVADFGGALSVKVGNYTNGGYWPKAGTAGNYPSAVSDNTCWIQKITYVSNKGVKELAAAKSNSTLWNIIKNNVYNKGKYGAGLKASIIADAKTVGLAATTKIAGYTITEIATAVSYLFWWYYGAQLVAAILNCYTYYTLTSWGNAGYGGLNIIYSTSYHGSWYQTYTETKWTTYPIVYKPADYYGTGSFKAY